VIFKRRDWIAVGVSLPVALAAILWGFGVFNSSPPPPAYPSPLCMPVAVSEFNAYWQAQVVGASLANVQAVLSEGIAATEQRIKLCGGGS
jgi:hypothetical protein